MKKQFKNQSIPPRMRAPRKTSYPIVELEEIDEAVSKPDGPPQAEPRASSINPELSKALETGAYDFVDFGSSKGGSLNLATKFLGLQRGIGLDIDPAKVAAAREAGFEAIEQDVTALTLLKNSVRVVIMSHFLEDLPSRQLAAKAVKSAIAAAKDFVFIRQPFFDANGPLMTAGLKVYSADWSGHTNLMTSYDLWLAAAPAVRRGEATLALLGRSRIHDSLSPSIVPLDAPKNIKKINLGEYSDKEKIVFEFPMFKELVAVIVKHDKNGPRADWKAVARGLGYDSVLRVEEPLSKAGPSRKREAATVQTAAPAPLAAAGEDKKFLFVCGVPRSGTTALAKLLNYHPQVAVGIERYKRLAMSADGIDGFNEALFAPDRFFDFRDTDTNVKADGDYLAMRGKFAACRYVGDKIPRIYMILPRLYAAFPLAKVVFITRHINAVADSWNQRADKVEDRNWPAENDFTMAVAEWNKANSIALRYAQERPGQFIVVRYEDILKDHEDFVALLLEKLDLGANEGFWKGYRDLMSSGGTRGARPPAKEGQEEFIRQNADFKLFGELEALALRPA